MDGPTAPLSPRLPDHHEVLTLAAAWEARAHIDRTEFVSVYSPSTTETLQCLLCSSRGPQSCDVAGCVEHDLLGNRIQDSFLSLPNGHRNVGGMSPVKLVTCT